ncbi:MAG TPA: 50S ribosomal protein L18 [Bacillota bacterium]|nr:50S ribosomal protein L18 [Bacillota bacterium]
MYTRTDSNVKRVKRHKRIRAKISGTAAKPRLSVYRSENNIYAQIIDDITGGTLVSASSVEKEFGNEGGNIASAKKIGKLVAERALAKGIEDVVFDRGGYLYHGRVQALAEAAREAGLKF